MAEIRYARSKAWKIVVQLAPEREGTIFVRVPSKALARALAGEVMGVDPMFEDLAALLYEVAEEPKAEAVTEPATKKSAGA